MSNSAGAAVVKPPIQSLQLPMTVPVVPAGSAAMAKPQIQSLQVFRGLAALAVVAHHASVSTSARSEERRVGKECRL